MVEFNIYQWAIRCNSELSIAPSTDLLEHVHHHFTPENLATWIRQELSLILTDHTWRRKQWLGRMRSLWNVNLKSLKPEHNLPIDVVKSKALAFFGTVNVAQTVDLPAPPVTPLVLNLDETSIKYGLSGMKGLVVSQKHCPLGNVRPHEKIVKEIMRGTMSFIATICSDSSVQPRVPSCKHMVCCHTLLICHQGIAELIGLYLIGCLKHSKFQALLVCPPRLES